MRILLLLCCLLSLYFVFSSFLTVLLSFPFLSGFLSFSNPKRGLFLFSSCRVWHNCGPILVFTICRTYWLWRRACLKWYNNGNRSPGCIIGFQLLFRLTIVQPRLFAIARLDSAPTVEVSFSLFNNISLIHLIDFQYVNDQVAYLYLYIYIIILWQSF